MPKEMPQHNTTFLRFLEGVLEDFAIFPAVIAQRSYCTKHLDSLTAVPAPMNQVNHIDMMVSHDLCLY